MARKNSLDLGTFLINAVSYLAVCQNVSVGEQIDTVDTRGIAERYERQQPVAGQASVDFTILSLISGGSTVRATGLDVSVWSIGGNDFVGDVESGSFTISMPTQDAQGINQFDKVPNAVGGQTLEISTKKMITTDAALTALAMNGSITDLKVAAIITFFGLSLTAPMLLTAARHTIDRGALQMEDVTLRLSGTPTGPATAGIINKFLLGDTTFTVDIDTAANEYATGGEQVGLMTRLTADFARGQEIKFSGTIAIQGQLAATAPA